MPSWPESEESQMDPYHHNIKWTIVIIIVVFVNSIQTQILVFLLDCVCVHNILAANQDLYSIHKKILWWGQFTIIHLVYCNSFQDHQKVVSFLAKSGFFLGFNPPKGILHAKWLSFRNRDKTFFCFFPYLNFYWKT